MSTAPDSQINRLLRAWSDGDQSALDRLTPLLYDEMRRLAHRHMRRERSGNTLQTTALANEAYLRLAAFTDVPCHDRSHFLALAAQIMRRILVDAARARRAAKRGGDDAPRDAKPFDFDRAPDQASTPSAQFIALDDALTDLARLDERKARVVELRFFGGLSVNETAAVLEVSPQSVMRDWKLARAWLGHQLSGASTTESA